MKLREVMAGSTENLSWCKPCSILGGRIIVAVNEGSIDAMQFDGQDVAPTKDNIRKAAMLANEDYDAYNGWSDTDILLSADLEELPCRKCPWFRCCDAMDDDIDQD